MVGGGPAQHRHESPFKDADLQPAVDLLRGEFAFFQEFFDQGVVAFGGEVHQIAPQFRHLVLQVVGDGPGFQLAAGAGVGLLADQVHHALEAGLFADGQLDGHGLHFQDILDALQGRGEIGPFPVQLVNKEQPWQVIVVGSLPDLLGAHLDAVHGVDHHHRGVAHVEGGPGVGHEVVVTGSVSQVDRVLLPLVMVKGAGDSDLALNFFGFVVEHGTAVIHPPQPGGGPCREQQGFCQRGFATAAVADKDQIADTCGFAHQKLSLSLMLATPPDNTG